MKISTKDKLLVLDAQKVFPEVWVFLQREANRRTHWSDVIYSLEQLLKVGDEITLAWAFLEWVLKERQRVRDQRRIDKNAEDWEKKKNEDKDWLKDCKLGDLVKGVGE